MAKGTLTQNVVVSDTFRILLSVDDLRYLADTE